jgi:GntR family transcriptional regulator, transcriptional repressor for pyruvate dehydrogenase complex
MKTPGKLGERVRAELESMILTGRVKVNEQLPTEADLASQFGVSRTVIREAINRLEAQGFVQARIGSGSFVVPFELNQIKAAVTRFAMLNTQRDVFLHLLDLRSVIESETVARLAKTREPAAMKLVTEALQAMRDNRHNRASLAKADIDFHLAIASAAANPLFSVILEPLKDLGRFYGLKTYTNREVIDRTCDEHGLIVSAIMAGDVSAAVHAVRAHIQSSRRHYLELIDSDPNHARESRSSLG